MLLPKANLRNAEIDQSAKRRERRIKTPKLRYHFLVAGPSIVKPEGISS